MFLKTSSTCAFKRFYALVKKKVKAIQLCNDRVRDSIPNFSVSKTLF